MANDRPTNFLEVLLKSLGQGVGTVGQNLPAQRQQEKSDALSKFSAMMDIEQNNRAKQTHQLSLLKGRETLKTANLNTQIAGEKLADMQLTDAEKTAKELKAIEDRNLGLQEMAPQFPGQVPDFEGFSPEQVPKFDLNEEIFKQSGIKGVMDFQQSKSSTGKGKTLDAKTQARLTDMEALGYSADVQAGLRKDILAGKTTGEDARTNYEQALRLNTPSGIAGILRPSGPAEVAKSARSSGWSPKANGTLLTVLQRLDDKLKTGGIVRRKGIDVVVTEKNIAKLRAAAKKHFNNIYEDVLAWAETQAQ